MKKIFLILISITLLSSCNSKEGITDEGVNKNCEASVISLEDLTNILYSKDTMNIQFVDIRTPHKYAIGHLPNAINMPMNNFFDKKQFDKLKKDAILILYGEDQSSPMMMSLMAAHFTGSKFYIAGGGYDFIKNKILDGYGIYSGIYDDEVPLVDFDKAVNEIKSRAGVSSNVKKAKPATKKPIVKRKKKEVSGGCG